MTYYELLKVNPDATDIEIRKAYYKAARETHPDKNPQNREVAEEAFKKIGTAYEVLSTPEKRAEYDAYLNSIEQQKKQTEESYQDHTTNQSTGDYSREQYSREEPEMDIDYAKQLFEGIEEFIKDYEYKRNLGKNLVNAVKDNNWLQANNLIDQGALLNELSDEGLSALHYVVTRNDAQHINYLIRSGAKIDTLDLNYNTVLHYATESENMDLCRLLINNQARLHFTNNQGDTPLHIALKNECVDLALLLANNPTEYSILKLKSHDTKDSNGNTPLHIALQQGCYTVVDALLTQGAKLGIQNKFGDTAMHLAAQIGYIRICERLYANEAKLHLKDNYGNTPLHIALKKGDVNFALALANNPTERFFGQKSHDEKDSIGNTPLHIALQKGYYNVADALLKQGAKVNIKNIEGETQISYLDTVTTQSTRVLLIRRENEAVPKCITM